MIAIGVVAFHVLGFVSSIHAVMSARTSQGSIAWAVVLNTFPYLAVPAYWVLGRSQFDGYVTARREGDLDLGSLVGEAAARLEALRLSPEETPPAARAAERMVDLPFLRGNAVDLLIDGEDTFASILGGIDRARDYILFQFFIVKDDQLGREIQSRLIAKAREGVRVYFLYDEVGSYALPRRYKNELRDAGVQVYDFHTQQGPRNRFQINFRNHRKVVVVDGGWSTWRLSPTSTTPARPGWSSIAIRTGSFTRKPG